MRENLFLNENENGFSYWVDVEIGQRAGTFFTSCMSIDWQMKIEMKMKITVHANVNVNLNVHITVENKFAIGPVSQCECREMAFAWNRPRDLYGFVNEPAERSVRRVIQWRSRCRS
jgi:hypothetical protein